MKESWVAGMYEKFWDNKLRLYIYIYIVYMYILYIYICIYIYIYCIYILTFPKSSSGYKHLRVVFSMKHKKGVLIAQILA